MHVLFDNCLETVARGMSFSHLGRDCPYQKCPHQGRIRESSGWGTCQGGCWKKKGTISLNIWWVNLLFCLHLSLLIIKSLNVT